MSAEFSLDRTRRFVLRRGPADAPYILYCGVNPSDAAEDAEDNTTRRLNVFTTQFGFDAWQIVNLDPFVSSDPAALATAACWGTRAPHREQHVLSILHAVHGATLIVPMWGAGVTHLGRMEGVALARWFIETACKGHEHKLAHFGLTKDGHPKHPLYLRGDTQLQPWRHIVT